MLILNYKEKDERVLIVLVNIHLYVKNVTFPNIFRGNKFIYEILYCYDVVYYHYVPKLRSGQTV